MLTELAASIGGGLIISLLGSKFWRAAGVMVITITSPAI